MIEYDIDKIIVDPVKLCVTKTVFYFSLEGHDVQKLQVCTTTVSHPTLQCCKWLRGAELDLE